MEGVDTKLGRLGIPKTAVAVVVVLGFLALSQVTNPVLASEPVPRGTPTPELTPEPEPTSTLTVPTAPSNEDAGKAQPDGLFSEVKGKPPPSSGVETLASRLVGIDFGQIAQVTSPPFGPKDPVTGKPTTLHTLVLNLFDDAVFTGIVEHVEPTSAGHALWGRLDGVELGTMTLVVNGSVVAGTVRTPDAVYTVRTAGDGAYVIRQIDESSLPPPGEPSKRPPGSDLAPRSGGDPRSDDLGPRDDGSEIDVIVVYTPAAKHREGGRAAIEALIDLYVAETNQAYANSGVVHRIRLVHREEVDYTEQYDRDLDRLIGVSDGYMDHVHVLRDQYAADLVHLVTVTGYGYCGVAFSDTVGDESEGFAITVYSCDARTFAHELGHNMGLRHDRYTEGGGRGSNFGYVNQRAFEPGAPVSARWLTIMAYSTQCADLLAAGGWCRHILYFSNPRVTYKGDPMGVPADHPSTGADGPADAVGTLNETRKVVANYRRRSTVPAPRVGLALAPYWLSENGGVSTVTATLHRPSRADTVITVSASPANAVTLSTNRTLTIPAGRTTSVGVVTITGVDNGNRTGEVGVTVSASVANASSEGVVPPDPVALAVVDDETTPVVTLSLSPTEVVEGEGPAFVTATLDNRSSAETTVIVSASPAEFVGVVAGDEEEYEGGPTLIIPAGQTSASGRPVEIRGVDDGVLTGARNRVIVSGAAENAHGVTGPESVTLTVIDDEAPIFADDSTAYTFTAGVASSRFLEAAHGNGPLTYSISPAPGNGVTFEAGPPARIGVSATSAAASPASYTITAADADGDTDTMTVTITVRSPVCPGSAAVSGAATGGMVADCEALLSARDALTGSEALNWSADTHITAWEGVEVGRRPKRVVGLELDYSNQLRGTIPSELGSLTSLRWLNLENSQLSGAIPPELGSLTNLEHLALWDNELTGEIPAELGSLTNLQSLGLGGNRLTGEIPAELGRLTNLEGLYLAYNELSGPIPAELGSLANLQWLELQSNELTGRIPAELGGLVNLRSLQLHRNQLTGPIPASLGGLTNLEELYLRGNRLTGCIPGTLSNVDDDDLGTLGLPFCGDHACVSGGAVTDTGNPELVSDCDTLLAARDTLAGTAALNWSVDTPIAEWDGVSLGGTPLRVTGLKLSGHGLSGEIPAELGSLSELGALLLQDNQLSGLIPAELGGLIRLERLFLSGNLLTGCIPDGLRGVRENDLDGLGLSFCGDHVCVAGGAVTDVGNPGLMSDCEALLAARDILAGSATLNWSADTPITQWDGVTVDGTPQRVTELSLGERGLMGEIPAELGNLSNLVSLSLWQNQLTGEIPTELGNLSNLIGLYLSSNQLTGEIPTEFGSLSNLLYLELIANQLRGEIPTELGNLSNLRWLLLWENQLTGEIPTELGDLSNLRELSLSSNQLTGEIPAELGNLSNLIGLYLSSNQLTGEIPVELGSLNNLQELNLDGNHLTGEIPTELGSLANLHSLDLSDNQLAGEITVDLGSLNNLQELHLNENQLTGEIPVELGSLNNLQWLSLYNNQLTGEIPMELGNLSELRGLELSSNKLTGVIPAELGNLSNLVVLSLWGNHLTRRIPTELEYLSNLRTLWLGGNPLSGCIPPALREVPENDLDNLGLPLCSVSLPGAPTIDAITPGMGTLAISWRPPSNRGGTAITAYDLRYVETAADKTMDSNWTVKEDVWSPESGALQYTLAGLTADTQYDIQVRAANSVGDGPWSETTTGTPAGGGDCATGSAVSDAANNSGLVSDCQTLLAVRDVLASPLADGEPRLNWSSNTPITDWDGIGDDSLQGSPTRVTRLYLNSLGLDGMIPSALSNLTALRVLHLHDNELTGTIPPALGGLPKLTYLYAHNNDLTGSIPTELGELTSLKRLYLHSNDLTGSIPTEMGKLTRLTHLWLKDNDLTGEIPSTLGDLSSLDWLHIAENDLSGEIPAELGTLTKLRRLYVYENDLSGPIPGELGSLTRLTHIVAQENDLSGEIPAELGNLTNLVWLGLYDNDLEGEIPDELGGLAKLQRLYLHHNELHGEIPEELGDLSEMTNLWLNHNYLSGQIPESLGDLTKLTRLRLAGNSFTGCLPAGLAAVENSDAASLSLPTCSVP